jgi:branched-chain amino acid transport system substrate-binding protein
VTERKRHMRPSLLGIPLTAGLVAVVALVAATSGFGAHAGTVAGQPPLKLGMIDTMSGPVAGVGTDGLKGAKVAVAEINKAGGVLGGRKLELEVKDEQLSPTASVKDIRDLNSDGVNLVFGFTSSADALAAMPVAKQLGMDVIAAHASATELRTGNWVPNFAAVAVSDYLSADAAPDFLKKQFPQVTNWNVYSYDYVTGHEGWNNFTKAMKAREPKFAVNKQVFIPQTATDLTSYITSALNGLPSNSGQNQGAYVFLYGAGEVDLFKQGAPYNISKKYKVILTEGGGFEGLADTLKTQTPNSWVGYDYSYLGFHTKVNSQFVKDYEAANSGTPPDTWAEQSYEAVLAYKAALDKAGTDDPSKVAATFGGLSFPGTQGTVTLDPKTHQAFLPETFTHFVPDASSKQGWKEENAVVIWPPKSLAKP